MPKFRKKPVVIEAVRFIDDVTEIEGAEPEWYRHARATDPDDAGSLRYIGGALEVRTLEGVMVASPGDWIIRGVEGELYPCKASVFAATYEPEPEPDQEMVDDMITALRDGATITFSGSVPGRAS